MTKGMCIVAVATAPGQGGIGVVRVSGPDVGVFMQALTGKTLLPRQATFARFRNINGDTLDEGIAIYFPAPSSFTGEAVLELQGHGGPAVMQSLLAACIEVGARLAEPGEFTRRAFLNGKLDLAQAESVADLISATSLAAARGALRSLSGEFSKRVHALTEGLINLRMLVEATLDFPEEDIDFLQAADAQGKHRALHADLRALLEGATQGKLLRDGLTVVLVGQPNVGKSSLLNALAGDEIAIVTAIAGTTRDTVRELIHIEGIPLHLIDTAGLRDTHDLVEQIGIARTWSAVEKADLILLLVDASHGIGEAEAEILARLPQTVARVTIHNKIDLQNESVRVEQTEAGSAIWLSAKTGDGIPELQAHILRQAGWQGNEGTFTARERHLTALHTAARHLQQADGLLDLAVLPIELFAEELRLAQTQLSTITGEFSSDDLLGEIFSRFCIGK